MKRSSRFPSAAALACSLVLLIVGPALASQIARAAEPAARPNIVIILADDLGYGSATCYGAHDLKTPNMDRLAREGRRFTQAYAPGSVCSPSRYGLMTGRYYWRTRIRNGKVLPVDAPLHFGTDRMTLASLCKSQGYHTAAFGKWHLGIGTERITDWSVPLKPGPLEVGFDHFFGLAANAWGGPHSYIVDHEVSGRIPGQPITVHRAGHEENTTSGIKTPWKYDEIMQTLTSEVVSWINKQQPDQPFFVYYAPNAVHQPVTPYKNFTGSKYGTYGDEIEELDWSVGQILDALDKHKLAANTLVIFTSDNGGVVARSAEETAKALDAGLAINGSLRGGKHQVWEGGFREPFIVRWPGKVPADTVSDQVICLTDMLATFSDILHVPLFKGQADDSFDVLRAFTEPTSGGPVRDHVILQAADATYAVRSGDWKLIATTQSPQAPAKPNGAKGAKQAKDGPRHDELFNLKNDPSEKHDVLADNKNEAQRLKKLLSESRKRGFTRPGAGE